MNTIEWTDELSVGMDLIDEQHKQWITHFNELAIAVDNCQGESKIGNTLLFLLEYTQFHFETEEKFMAEYPYEEREAHVEKHRMLIDTVEDLARDYKEEGATHSLAEAVDTFLGNWLIDHIRQTDMGFGAALRAAGAEQTTEPSAV